MLKWIQSSVWWSVCYRILSERAIWHNLKILTKTLGSWKPTWEIWKNQVYFWSVWGSSAVCTREWPHRYMSTTCRHVSIIQPTIREKIVPTGDVPATNKSQFLAFCDSSHLPIDFCWGKQSRKEKPSVVKYCQFSNELAHPRDTRNWVQRQAVFEGTEAPTKSAAISDLGRNLLVKYVGSRGNGLGTGPLPAAKVGRGVGRK